MRYNVITIVTAITAAALAAGAAAFEAPRLPEPATADRDGAVAFAGLPPPPLPEWLRPGAWDTLRVTARGAGAPQERITVTSAPDATRIIIK